MVKTLTKHGNSYALIIEQAILSILEIAPDTPLKISTDGKKLTITPVTAGSRSERVQKALAKTNAKYGKALKKLAE